MLRVFDFLGSRDLPLMTRPNYRAELKQIALWGLITGAVEANIAAIVASKTFNASPAATTLIWALPGIMLTPSLLWSFLLRGRRRVPTFSLVVVGVVLAIASVGLLPPGQPHAAWFFALQIGAIHLFLTALTTLRTTTWQLNYPTTHRARITGRLTTVRILLAVVAGAGLGLIFDENPAAYRIVYPAVAVAGALSLIPLREMRVRGEKHELRRFRALRAVHEERRPAMLARFWQGLREARGILRDDRPFAQYMGGMFLLGSANFFAEPLLVYWVTTRLKVSYFIAAVLTIGIPTVVTLFGLRYWAPLYDRVGLLRFRISNSVMWMLSYAGLLATMLSFNWGGHDYLVLTIAMLIFARIMNGLGNGGGMLAWNLGHLHFARPHQTELYMGIHVGLTGVRAMVMPTLGWACSQLIGDGSFVISLALAFAALLAFRRMDADDRRSAV